MSGATYQLTQATRAAEALKERLAAEFAGDEQAIRDTLEGEIGLEGLISWASKEMLAAQGMVDGLQIIVNEMVSRGKRYGRRIDALRAAIEAAMTAGEIKKLVLPHITLTMAKGRAGVIITDATLIPRELLHPPKPQTPDMKEILATLQRDVDVPGAELSNPAPRLVVRTK